MREYEKAIAAYKVSLKLDPVNQEYKRGIADAQLRLKADSCPKTRADRYKS